MKYTKKDIVTTLTGFLMAMADSVPGVSGGTISYVMGKYDDFVGSIASLSRKASTEDRKKGIDFLIKLLMGWVVGMGLAILLVSSLVSEKPYEMSSLFLGFVVVSLPFIFHEEGLIKHINIKNILSALAGLILVVLISTSSSNAINLGGDISFMKYVYIFFGGMIAICAMVLPGISGSTFLLIFGLYVPIITAAKDMMHFNFSQIDICLVFGVGVLIGLFYFSKIVKYLLANYRTITVYFVVGLMLGSLYAICLGPTTLSDEVTKMNLGLDPLTLSTFKPIWFIVGVIFIIALEKLKTALGGKQDA